MSLLQLRLPLSCSQSNGRIPKCTVKASIVMVDVRAAGKTTLAIMAASALKRIVDQEAAFQRATGLPARHTARSMAPLSFGPDRARSSKAFYEALTASVYSYARG
ncbi:hypothetical protein E4U55_001793 [Claviceps digitariae]|nr:hypothetical protein E4U55_001793 [Claviceps digitariae]